MIASPDEPSVGEAKTQISSPELGRLAAAAAAADAHRPANVMLSPSMVHQSQPAPRAPAQLGTPPAGIAAQQPPQGHDPHAHRATQQAAAQLAQPSQQMQSQQQPPPQQMQPQQMQPQQMQQQMQGQPPHQSPPQGYPQQQQMQQQHMHSPPQGYPQQPQMSPQGYPMLGANGQQTVDSGVFVGYDPNQAANMMSPVGQQDPYLVPTWKLAVFFIGAVSLALTLTIIIARLAR
jgi:hypothetical protein